MPLQAACKGSRGLKLPLFVSKIGGHNVAGSAHHHRPIPEVSGSTLTAEAINILIARSQRQVTASITVFVSHGALPHRGANHVG